MTKLAKHRVTASRGFAATRTERSLRREMLIPVILLLGGFLVGCSARHYRTKVDEAAYKIIAQKQLTALNRTEEFTVDSPAYILRRRLLLDQNLPLTGPASLGSAHLERVPHWPERPEPVWGDVPAAEAGQDTKRRLVLSLNDSLQIAARSSREYQDAKEAVFRAALDLDLARDEFRTTFAGLLSGLLRHDRTGLDEPGGALQESFDADAIASASQKLKSGSLFSLRLGWNLVKMLEPRNFTSRSVFGDASVAIPLLRGAGEHIAAEPLTQAERNSLYAVCSFERFKREFAVDVAREYLSVLESADRVKNAAENYRGLIASSRRARRLLDAGDLPPIQVDQSIQEELSARNRWINAREAETAALDSFKVRLGLPTDADIELDRNEFEQLSQSARRLTAGGHGINPDEPIPPADTPILLPEPSRENAGPYELDPQTAIHMALVNRLDLRVAYGRTDDAQRAVVVAADRLRSELTLFGRATLSGETVREVKFNRGDYEAFLVLDPGFERTAEAIGYRESLLNLERVTRELQKLEDEVKQDVRASLRTLREARESLQIQTLAVELARRRVRGADLNLQAGRAQVRDLLEAQEDLLGAQNAFTGAAVDYRLAELQLQRDLDVLEVGPDGLWKEFDPTTLR